MGNSKHQSSIVGSRRNGIHEEQRLCNEALESGAYDSVSDKDWVELCEQVATKGRKGPDSDDTQESYAVPSSLDD